MQHIKRWITALILAPFILWLLIKGSLMAIAVLVSMVAVFSVREYLRIIFGNTDEPVSNTIKIISYTVSVLLVVGAYLGSWEILFLVLALNLMALAIFVLSRFAVDQATGGRDLLDHLAAYRHFCQ